MLWFDVGNGRYTTLASKYSSNQELWFDVGNGRYTTNPLKPEYMGLLWFDVGNGRYTTEQRFTNKIKGCGLM